MPRLWMYILGIVAGWLLCASAARSDPTISIVTTTGPDLSVAINISDLGTNQVAGYQVFVQFDPTRFAFVDGTYNFTNFSLPLIYPIAANGGRISLAAGVFPGQPLVASNSTLATLRFQVLNTGCAPEIWLVANTSPPTRLTAVGGSPIVPLRLVSLQRACLADFNELNGVTIDDIFIFLNAWFAGSCAADADGFNGVKIDDIFIFLNAWFAGCP